MRRQKQTPKTWAHDTPRAAASLSMMSSDDTMRMIMSHSSIGSIGSDVDGARAVTDAPPGASGAALAQEVTGWLLLPTCVPPASAADVLVASPVPPLLPATAGASALGGVTAVLDDIAATRKTTSRKCLRHGEAKDRRRELSGVWCANRPETRAAGGRKQRSFQTRGTITQATSTT